MFSIQFLHTVALISTSGRGNAGSLGEEADAGDGREVFLEEVTFDLSMGR